MLAILLISFHSFYPSSSFKKIKTHVMFSVTDRLIMYPRQYELAS